MDSYRQSEHQPARAHGTVLSNGKVLIAGGNKVTANRTIVLSSAELYNPSTDGKKYTQIDAPSPDTSSAAWGINNKGQITVYAINSAGTGYDSFLLTGKKFTQLRAFYSSLVAASGFSLT